MIKKSIVLFSMLTSVYSQTVDIQTNKVVNENSKVMIHSDAASSYKDGLAYYKNKEYQKAYDSFSEAFKYDMGNKNINFYLGRSAYEIQNYDMAISAYDRILLTDPNNARVRLELGQTYLKMQQFTQAKKEFSEALKLKMPKVARKRAEANIKLIERKEKKHFINSALVLGINYDSNINSSADAGDYSIYVPQFGSNLSLSNDGTKQSATSYQAVALVNHLYKYKDDLSLGNRFTAFAQKYNNFKDKDIHAFSYAFTPTYYRKGDKFDTAFGIDKLWMAHKPYLVSYSIYPKYTKILNKITSLEIGVKYSKKRHSNSEDKFKNTDNYEWKNNLKYLTKDYGIFSVGIDLGKEVEAYEQRTDVSKEFYKLSIGNSYNIKEKYLLTTSLSFQNTLYKDNDVNFLSRRDENKYDLSVGLTRAVNKKLSLTLGAGYSNTVSNYSPFDHDKYTLKSSIIYVF